MNGTIESVHSSDGSPAICANWAAEAHFCPVPQNHPVRIVLWSRRFVEVPLGDGRIRQLAEKLLEFALPDDSHQIVLAFPVYRCCHFEALLV